VGPGREWRAARACDTTQAPATYREPGNQGEEAQMAATKPVNCVPQWAPKQNSWGGLPPDRAASNLPVITEMITATLIRAASRPVVQPAHI